jgi:NAD(P)-dependent dehydrogenase (short-subunit alcohol dehydrogenase family)
VKQFEDKVAVVTGAASGIGRAYARRCMAEGMQVVLADIEPAALTAIEVEARGAGAAVLGVLTDVANPKDMERLAERTLAKFGAVHLLFNNAGVGTIGPALWDCTGADWSWILGVNLWGLIHGLKVFVPIMIEQSTECHIVNTASAAGLLPTPGMGICSASKAAVIAVSETLQHELTQKGVAIRVSVVCPGSTHTRIVDASRNRPAALRDDPWVEAARKTAHAAAKQKLLRATKAGMPADEVADLVFLAIEQEQLYIFTHPWVKTALELRVRSILYGTDPLPDTGLNELDR